MRKDKVFNIKYSSMQILEDKIVFKIIFATIPAIIVGFFIYDLVNLYFRNIEVNGYHQVLYLL